MIQYSRRCFLFGIVAGGRHAVLVMWAMMLNAW